MNKIARSIELNNVVIALNGIAPTKEAIKSCKEQDFIFRIIANDNNTEPIEILFNIQQAKEILRITDNCVIGSLSLQSDDKQSYDNVDFIKSYDEYRISCDLLNDDYAKVYNHKFTEEDINKLSSWLKEILSIGEFIETIVISEGETYDFIPNARYYNISDEEINFVEKQDELHKKLVAKLHEEGNIFIIFATNKVPIALSLLIKEITYENSSYIISNNISVYENTIKILMKEGDKFKIINIL